MVCRVAARSLSSLFFSRSLVVDGMSTHSCALIFVLTEPNGGASAPGNILRSPRLHGRKGNLTLENEDAVAMGTVNPSVTQRVPCW